VIRRIRLCGRDDPAYCGNAERDDLDQQAPDLGRCVETPAVRWLD
jgi:hypothetical protein